MSSKFSSTSLLSLASLNAKGLSKTEKQEELGTDCFEYSVDILCVQETKVKNHSTRYLRNNYKLIMMEQNQGRHGGLGFIISPRLIPYVTDYQYTSDRVSYLNVVIPSNLSSHPKNIRIVNGYGPTNPKAEGNPALLRKFYRELTHAISVPASHELFVCGDLNSKLGTLSSLDYQYGVTEYMGKFGMGTRNFNGEHLLNFMCLNKLFATNTYFDHPCRHRTTFSMCISAKGRPKGSKLTRPVFAQLDYILCRTRSRFMFQDCRSYGGLATNSDHRLVACKIKLAPYYKIFPTKKISSVVKRYNNSLLTTDLPTKVKYQLSVEQKVNNSQVTSNPNDDLTNLMDVLKTTADEVIGTLPRSRNRNFSSDSTVEALVKERQTLQAALNCNNQVADRTQVRTRINRLQKDIRKHLKNLADTRADDIARTIMSTDDTRQMFEAVRTLADTKPKSTISVHNEVGNFVATDAGKAQVIRDYYEKQFTCEDEPLQAFIGDGRCLDIPITCDEVKKAAQSLKNNKATGPDKVYNEWLKNAGTKFWSKYAEIINSALETNSFPDVIGEAIITPLPKPRKPAGLVTSLRPLCLSNGARKILSMIVLKRIEDKVDAFTGSTQAGYKHGRSCGDLVWAERMLISVVTRKHFQYHKMGIDMSRAFDTIKRQTILDLLVKAGCTDDDLRLVRLLLTNTMLKVRVEGELSTVFESLLGSFQGDSLSGKLFTLVLAGALIELRHRLEECPPHIPNPPISKEGMPLESAYSDDCNFMNVEKESLEAILPIAKEVFKEFNLFINTEKTEFTHVFLAPVGETIPGRDDTMLRGNEDWRKSKILGSLLCSESDIAARCIAGNNAFYKFTKIWSQQNISVTRKIAVYEAQIVSIIMYNCSSWCPTAKSLEKLDICHRKHLRSLLNIYWPHGTISNANLYLRCNSVKLSDRVPKARWKLLGHILRSADDSPAALALKFAVTTNCKGRVGAHRKNLFKIIVNDLTRRGLKLNSLNDLNKLKILADDRVAWRNKFLL